MDEWGAGGDPAAGTGFITHRRVPVTWWLLDRWLGHGHPHWDWWASAWRRLSPYWGDPFCAAYTVAWKRIYEARAGETTWLEVRWDELPEAVRSRALERAVAEE